MKKLFLIASLACMAMACQNQPKEEGYVQTGTEEVGTYTVDVIEKNIYHLQDFNSAYPAGNILNDSGQVVGFNNPSDMYLLVGDKEALLIDLSNDIKWADNAAESLQKVVSDRIGNLPLTITFTHNHGDHTGMLPAYVSNPEVKFALPKVDFEKMADKFPAGQTSMYEDGYQFDLGGIKVNSVMVPGHTHGSMVFFVEGKDICFSGDAIGSGQGVWLFNMDCFKEYTIGVPKLLAYINDPANGINKDNLIFWGGHYHQRSGLDPAIGETMGYSYLEQSQELINQILDGTAESVPVSFNKILDTHFKYKNAGIVWNDSLANVIRAEKQ